jgi:hypothetical protein
MEIQFKMIFNKNPERQLKRIQRKEKRALRRKELFEYWFECENT